MKLDIIILAAGQGSRMYSDLPKVLHRVAGQPMLARVIGCARALSPHGLHVVVGYGAEEVRAVLRDDSIRWWHQAEQQGTGHAVQQALPGLQEDHDVLVLYGDVPLLAPATLQAVLRELSGNDLVLLSAELADPSGYGRIVRDAQGRVLRIAEEQDADPQTLGIREVNTGVLATRSALLKQWLAGIETGNAQGEYYLTDCIGWPWPAGTGWRPWSARMPRKCSGVNDKHQLIAGRTDLPATHGRPADGAGRDAAGP